MKRSAKAIWTGNLKHGRGMMDTDSGKRGFVPDSIHTKAEVNLENVVGDWSINSVHLKVIANIPEASEEIIKQCANSAKENCPVSKLLNTDITMDLKIISQESNLHMNA